jgi:hypothetical protein
MLAWVRCKRARSEHEQTPIMNDGLLGLGPDQQRDLERILGHASARVVRDGPEQSARNLGTVQAYREPDSQS